MLMSRTRYEFFCADTELFKLQLLVAESIFQARHVKFSIMFLVVWRFPGLVYTDHRAEL